jgi:hypothetical protein
MTATAAILLDELQRRGYYPSDAGDWFDLHGDAGMLRVAPDDTDIVVYMFDRHMVNLWAVRLSSVPGDMLAGALNIAEASLALQGRADECEGAPDETCTELECTECGAPAGAPCEIGCIADQALPPR